MLQPHQVAAFEGLPKRVFTARLLLEQLTPGHVTETYLSWFSNDEVVRFLESRDVTREEAVLHMEQGAQSHEFRLYAICWRDTGEHIGNLKVGPINWRHGVSDLVTVIGARSAWGKGVAREAIEKGSEVAFDHLHLRKLSGAIYSDNIGSIKAYTAAGWVIEGALACHCVSDGRAVDRILISKFNPRYFPDGPPRR